jgi:quercetin 2,3-dioxygenase
MEEFFLKMNELKGPPTKEQAEKIHEVHGMTVLGPGLSLK